jgi:hypothetical protein
MGRAPHFPKALRWFPFMALGFPVESGRRPLAFA